ncbi:ATP-binding protein [Streptomyces sp. HU2014]|uniref:ATP-binding protein n=1 Tax=Streptomyces sp. HU2014 TaxID=2939414 RepID=UPI00200C8826|nr:ATP-binding protein [Streptomyces sp. HU2014]UQI47569.1 ATP-binding protein [Streptomyces sp. HU2014]
MYDRTPCLPDPTRPPGPPAPSPGNLSYSLGLPSNAHSLGTARTVVRRVLCQHGLSDLAELGVLATSELLANACLFTPGREAGLSVRWRYGVLRLTVSDEHPPHPAGAREMCRARRRAALSTLDAVVDACGGICGLDETAAPLGGSRMWAVFSREAGENYAKL